MFSVPAVPHPGGLDANGGHVNKKTGEYHYHRKKKAPAKSESNQYKDRVFVVKRVVDGDTVVLDNGEKVRLIGVDTPESHKSKKLYRDAERSQQDVETIRALGKRATAFTNDLVQGRKVLLEFDESNAVKGNRDRYGRLLAFISLYQNPEKQNSNVVIVTNPNGNIFVNATIIRSGFGNAYTKYPFKYMEDFRTYEKEARSARRGLWK
ncbi:MAG: thermonuclease family protein [Elusimicrobia bacterium]|nr:thermonuclease family protein [Candidatus Obscuribacterium magneticum]